MMYRIYRFFVFIFPLLMVPPPMYAYTPHPGIVVSWIGCLGTFFYRDRVITKLINKADNEKWEEEQKKKKIQLYVMSEDEQQIHSDAIQRLKKAGYTSELIQQCIELDATTELLEKLLALYARPDIIESIIKGGSTPLIFYKQLTKEITAQEAGWLMYINNTYPDRKVRFNSKLEYDEYRKKFWDQLKKDRPLLAALGITAYATLIDFFVKPPPSYRFDRDPNFVQSPGFQGVGSASTRKPNDPVPSAVMGEIPDYSKESYEHWDDDIGLPECSITYDALKENQTVYYCPWSHTILSCDPLDQTGSCFCGQEFKKDHFLRAVFYREQDKYYIRIPVRYDKMEMKFISYHSQIKMGSRDYLRIELQREEEK